MIELNIFDDKTTHIIGKGEDVSFPQMNPVVSCYMLPLYDNFNQKNFDTQTNIIKPFEELSNLVYDVFNQNRPKYDFSTNETLSFPNSSSINDVILGFSGGLDSCYQAIVLKEKGYNVHLFHVNGINAYEGRVQMNAVESFAKKMGMELCLSTWKRLGKQSTNKYYQQWGDNAIKNQFIESIMIDICLERGYNKISLGDDESISVYDSDAKLGINITDCKEVQNTFWDAISSFCKGLEYIGIKRPAYSTKFSKLERLKLLEKYNLQDDYYSCVGSGRFNQYNHNTCEKKYGIKLHRYNCGCYCTKCSIHNLILHYVGGIKFPENFISKCWERLWNTKHGNFEELFGKDIPLEKRVRNLLTY